MTALPVLDCRDCGLCCSEQGTPPMMMDEYTALPVELQWDRRLHADRYDRGLPCLWFNVESKRCEHYEHRPEACRTAVVPGDEWCLEFRHNGGK